MVAALVLVAGALVVAVMAPRVLGRFDQRRTDPTLGVACWLLSIAGVALTAGLGLTLVLLPGHGAGSIAAGLVYSCWTTVRHGGIPRLDEAVGGAGLLGLAGLVARLGHVAVRDLRRHDRRCRGHLDALTLVGQTDQGGTVWVPSTRPAAFTVGGRRRVVVATTALRELPAPARAAVLAHERAHLTGRHHLVVAVVDAVCAAAPPLPLFRAAPGAVRELVELAADRAAAHRHGAGAVKQALLMVASHPPPAGALGMGGAGGLGNRLAALDHQRPPAPRWSGRAAGHLLRRGAASGAAVLLPMAAAAGLSLGLTLISCS